MGYLIEAEGEFGSRHLHNAESHVAASVVEALVTMGRRVTSIRPNPGSKPLPISAVIEKMANKAKWRKEYGINLYAKEDAWARKHVLTSERFSN